MNAYHQAQKAYASATINNVGTGRSAEYQAFSDIIRRLSQAANAPSTNFAELAAAIHDNRSLWTILASDVASSENALPELLRAQIFYLAEFTDFHSRKILRGEGDVSVLIEVNSAVMRGLSASPVKAGGAV